MSSNVQKLSRRMVKHRSECGATATEYGLLMAFIALAIVLGLTAFGNALNLVYQGFATFVANGF